MRCPLRRIDHRPAAGRANACVTGFGKLWLREDGTFNLNSVIIIDNQATIKGEVYWRESRKKAAQPNLRQIKGSFRGSPSLSPGFDRRDPCHIEGLNSYRTMPRSGIRSNPLLLRRSPYEHAGCKLQFMRLALTWFS